MLKDVLLRLPTWALIVALIISLPMATYAVTEHLRTDTQQSEDIRVLASTVQDMAKIVEYNYKETENNTEAVKDLQRTQGEIRVLLARVEAQLDRLDR